MPFDSMIVHGIFFTSSVNICAYLVLFERNLHCATTIYTVNSTAASRLVTCAKI